MTTSEHSQPMLAHPFPFPAFAINAGAPFYFPDCIVLEICASSSWESVKRQLHRHAEEAMEDRVHLHEATLKNHLSDPGQTQDAGDYLWRRGRGSRLVE